MSEDYDRLSPLGETQAIRLGEFWARHNFRFSKIFHGPAKRHVRTMDLAMEKLYESGHPPVQPELLADWDEFDAFQVMKLMLPVLVERDPEVRELYGSFQRNQQSPEAGRLLQKAFEAVARHWCSGEFDMPEVESWSQFAARIQRGLRSVQDQTPRSSHVAVFTSGGPIAATMAYALDLHPLKAIEFVWLSRNCSWSEFVFSGDRFSVSAYNSFPHLDSRELLSYR